jgi:hypothetical protein
MSTSSGGSKGESRRAPRVPGPFDGRRIGDTTIQVRVHGLSAVGCLIQSGHDVPVGRQITIEIDLPYEEGTVRVDAESVNTRPGYGFGVTFINMADEVREKIERLIEWKGGGWSRHDGR